MHSGKRVLWVLLFLLPLLTGGSMFAQTVDETNEDEAPDVTARVARFSFIRGDVQVRRAGNKDWEKATENLPIVEGDELSTGDDSRAEIQLDSTSHLRINARSCVKVTTLRDEGIALSVSQGTMSVRLLEFDKAKSYFEIDAPMTTVAIQKSGVYRIDAGTNSDNVVRVAAAEFGEARVYTDSSGFTLRNGRSARINIEGALAGEYETADAAAFADEFDSWALDRDAVIAKRLSDAYYDKYYDRDIYGAEDLNDSGEWVYTRQYGYVWRPFATSIRSYANWSPYRYGSWRWVPPFGWTWVNDEPWGWATYHHGRWIYNNGYWVWSPYGYHRGRRSWWSPALVVFNVIRDTFCWYPLPYNYVSYNFNYYYGGGRRGGRRDRDRDRDRDYGGRRDPRPNPSPSPGRITGPGRMQQMPFYNVPVGGVVAVNASDFGSGSKGFKTPAADVAKIVLSKDPEDVNTIPRLPKFEEVASRATKEIRPEKPPVRVADNYRIGVAERKNPGPVDDELRNTRILGGRQPVLKAPDEGPANVDRMERGGARLRNTGAVQRPVSPTIEPADKPVKTIPRYVPKPDESEKSGEQIEAPRKSVMPRIEQRKDDEPRYEPPRRSVEPRIEQPKREEPKREEPRRIEPPQRTIPRSEPRQEQPKQEQPKSQPRQDPPKIEKPSIIERKKDGSGGGRR